MLLHLSEAREPVTSEFLAPRMKTNPVVFRRTLAGLRDAGIVRSEKGHGGGWSLARGLDAITLAEVLADARRKAHRHTRKAVTHA